MEVFRCALRAVCSGPTVFVRKTTCSKSARRYTSVASVLTSNQLQQRIVLGALPPIAAPQLNLPSKILTFSLKDDDAKQKHLFFSVGSAPSTLKFSSALQRALLSNRAAIDYVLPGKQSFDHPIYIAPLGYSRTPVVSRIGDLPLPVGVPIGRVPAEDAGKVAIREPEGSRERVEKHAARLIVIRRKKMKRHKLRKLRKKMKFVWAKRRLRREARKRKVFEEGLLARMKVADEFDAESWVHEFLRKSTTDPATLIKRQPRLPRPTRYVLD